jgi:hypothetical protein
MHCDVALRSRSLLNTYYSLPLLPPTMINLPTNLAHHASATTGVKVLDQAGPPATQRPYPGHKFSHPLPISEFHLYILARLAVARRVVLRASRWRAGAEWPICRERVRGRGTASRRCDAVGVGEPHSCAVWSDCGLLVSV